MHSVFEICENVPRDDLLKRMEGLKRLMADLSIDFAFIYENINRFYFSGTMQKGLLAVPLEGEPVFYAEKGRERARAESPFRIVDVKNERETGTIVKGLCPDGYRAGLELDVLPVSVFERLKGTLGFGTAVDVTPGIKDLRVIKSAFEIEQVKRSGTISDEVFRTAETVVKAGVTELEIEAALVGTGRRLGHHGALRMRGINQEIMLMAVQSGASGVIPTFVDGPIPGGGITPAVPHGSSFKRIEEGIPVTIDYCAGYNGYYTDETRAFVVGELGEIFRKPYETARAILEDAMAYGREGVDCTELWDRAYALVRKAGLEEFFMGHGEGQVSFLGHGIGLEINELPVITGKHRRVLREGMVFALEPKFVLPPHGAIGIEMDVIVRPRGLERVTAGPIDLIQVQGGHVLHGPGV